jgi:hypothetical protein
MDYDSIEDPSTTHIYGEGVGADYYQLEDDENAPGIGDAYLGDGLNDSSSSSRSSPREHKDENQGVYEDAVGLEDA